MRSFVALVVVLTVAPAGFAGDVSAQTVSEPRSSVAAVTDRIVTASALLPVSHEQAFEYFARNDLLEAWLTPAADVEARVGGKYELFWAPADRENNSTIGCHVTAVATGQFIAFQWRSPRQFKAFANAADPLTHVVVMFVPEGTGTRVHLVHSGWRSGPAWEEARIWQERAWTGAFRQLEQVAAR
jgi:uncharacterized protein YndB with AHSA1/START domain